MLHDIVIPFANTAKYQTMDIDVRIKWNEHVKKKI